jgi:glucan-binding YG repeat protein
MNKRVFKTALSFVLIMVLMLQLNSVLLLNSFAVTPGSVSNPTTIPGQWLQNSDNTKWWYKHNDNSYTTNDWEYINGEWYHFDSSGWMQTGWLQQGSVWYYLGSNGKMRTGWQQDSNNTYYFYESGQVLGQMKVGWKQDGNDWYYFNTSGHMLKSEWLTYQSNKYYFDSDGKMHTGWLELNGDTYYFIQTGDDKGKMKTGWKQSGDDWYYFNSDGKMQTGWLDYLGDKYYLNDDGTLQYNTFIVQGKEYIIEDTTGKLLRIELHIKCFKQRKSMWCWAACAQAIGTYNNPSIIFQGDLAQAILGDRNANYPVSHQQAVRALEIASWDLKTATLIENTDDNYISLDTIKAEIDNNRPIEMLVRWGISGGGHAVVVAGYKYNTGMIMVYDPGYNQSSDISYAKYSYLNFSPLNNGVNLLTGTATCTHIITYETVGE